MRKPQPRDPLASWPYRPPIIDAEYRVVDERNAHWRLKSVLYVAFLLIHLGVYAVVFGIGGGHAIKWIIHTFGEAVAYAVLIALLLLAGWWDRRNQDR